MSSLCISGDIRDEWIAPDSSTTAGTTTAAAAAYSASTTTEDSVDLCKNEMNAQHEIELGTESEFLSQV